MWQQLTSAREIGEADHTRHSWAETVEGLYAAGRYCHHSMKEDDLIHHLCVCVCVWVDTQNIMCGPTSQPSGEGLPRTEGTFSSARLQERRQHEGRLLQERDHTQTQNHQPQDGEETDPASTLSDGSLLLWLLTVRGQQQLYRERLTESKWLTPHRMFRTEAASKISEFDVTIICRNKNKMHQQTSKSELVSVSICRLNMWTQVCSGVFTSVLCPRCR